MTPRSELAAIVYTFAVVLLAFVQFAHEAWDGSSTTPSTRPVMITLIAEVRQ